MLYTVLKNNVFFTGREVKPVVDILISLEYIFSSTQKERLNRFGVVVTAQWSGCNRPMGG